MGSTSWVAAASIRRWGFQVQEAKMDADGPTPGLSELRLAPD